MPSTLSSIHIQLMLVLVFVVLSTVFGMYVLYYNTSHHLLILSDGIPVNVEQNITRTERRLLTLMTTLRISPSRTRIHENTIRNWAALSETVHPVLVVPEQDNAADWIELAESLGWGIHRTNDVTDGIPIFTSMFTELEKSPEVDTPFVGYANADILFDEGLWATLSAVLDKHEDDGQRLLLTGRRRNTDVSTVEDSTCFSCLRNMSRHLEEGRTDAEDYFLFSKSSFPWRGVKVPPFVVGRRGYDNWLVSVALQAGVTVIDTSDTVRAIHQTTTKKEAPSGDRRVNYNLAMGANYKQGHTTCAPWRTTPCYNKTNSTTCVKVRKRRARDICAIRSGFS